MGVTRQLALATPRGALLEGGITKEIHGIIDHERHARRRRPLWTPNPALEPKMRLYVYTNRGGIYIINL